MDSSRPELDVSVIIPVFNAADTIGAQLDALARQTFTGSWEIIVADNRCTDRTKDVIKSGGEWISSIEIENTAVGHPGIAEAAVIGVPHEKWSERPLLIVVRAEGEAPEKDEILSFFEGKIAKWWLPDDVVFVDEIPHTATGKIKKTALREQFGDYKLPA